MSNKVKISLEIEYKPIAVLNILKRMKNISSLMMDLSYYSFLYHNKEIAEKVLELEEEVEKLNYLLIMNSTLAVRDKEDAETIAGIIQIGNALSLISNAAADIAKMVLDDIAPGEFIMEAFEEAEEVVAALTVKRDSQLVGKKIEFMEKNDVFIDVIAIKKRDGELLVDPKPNVRIDVGDTIIVRGSIEMVDKLFKMNGEKKFSYKRGQGYEKRKRFVGEELLIDRIIEMKDKVELMLDLAYSAVMLNDKAIAEQTLELENYFDWLYNDFEFLILSLLGEDIDKTSIVALLRLGIAAENMADGAYKIAETVVRGLKPHPILKRVIDESEEFMLVHKVKRGSKFIGRTVGEIEDAFGVQVVALRRGDQYFFDVEEDFKVLENDILILRGFEESREDLYDAIGKR